MQIKLRIVRESSTTSTRIFFISSELLP
jgi:hypothetical protein